jgi:hypothetical protein
MEFGNGSRMLAEKGGQFERNADDAMVALNAQSVRDVTPR